MLTSHPKMHDKMWRLVQRDPIRGQRRSRGARHCGLTKSTFLDSPPKQPAGISPCLCICRLSFVHLLAFERRLNGRATCAYFAKDITVINGRCTGNLLSNQVQPEEMHDSRDYQASVHEARSKAAPAITIPSAISGITKSEGENLIATVVKESVSVRLPQRLAAPLPRPSR